MFRKLFMDYDPRKKTLKIVVNINISKILEARIRREERENEIEYY